MLYNHLEWAGRQAAWRERARPQRHALRRGGCIQSEALRRGRRRGEMPVELTVFLNKHILGMTRWIVGPVEGQVTSRVPNTKRSSTRVVIFLPPPPDVAFFSRIGPGVCLQLSFSAFLTIFRMVLQLRHTISWVSMCLLEQECKKP